MRSYSRNSCKLGVTTAVSLLLATAAQAADPAHSFVLTAYSNSAGGADLVSGNYQAASEALHHAATFSASDESAISNNRCVALTVTHQWTDARGACDRAVRDAQQEKNLLPSYQYWARKLKSEYLAVALSNRAVLHWMASESDAAANDLKRAEVLSPNADFVTRNRAALEYSRTAVAQVAVAPVGH
jgi:hypothetical protein